MAEDTTNKVNLQLHLLEPRATEKSYFEQSHQTYVFPVKRKMSKQEIVKLVEKEFNVTVIDVRTMIRKGKKTKYSKGKHAYPGITHRQDKKYAYVRLKKGDSIKVFDDEPKEDKKTSAKDAKAEAKAEKKTAKAKESAKADKNAGKENK